tara:strand:+ start:214 stop:888 length:675 start_codon:yes stop_codon:yes gene_type:complete
MSRGASNENGGNVKFNAVTMRGFVQRVEEGTPNSVARKLEAGDNIGKVVHEVITNAIEGRVLKVEKVESQEYGDSYSIHVDTSVNGNGEKHIITTKLNSNYTRNLIKQLVKIDAEKDVKFSHRYEEPKGDYKYGMINLGVLQVGEDGKNHFVGYAYTNANPNGLPSVGEFIDGEGKKRKSYLDQNLFLEEALQKIEFPSEPVADREETVFEHVDSDEDEDELPF